MIIIQTQLEGSDTLLTEYSARDLPDQTLRCELVACLRRERPTVAESKRRAKLTYCISHVIQS